MKDKKFFRILIVILVLGVVLTALYLVYIALGYMNSSIIEFISQEWWP
ncbi:MAG: hypothetical protein J5757_05430 [Lachnospiraceae bacterium]|nr:hypothetical protein [Lachnospiraceae bacterium]